MRIFVLGILIAVSLSGCETVSQVPCGVGSAIATAASTFFCSREQEVSDGRTETSESKEIPPDVQ